MKFKRIICVLSVLATLSMSAYASEAMVIENQEIPTSEDGTVSPQAEETVWLYRINDGKMQKRLWSYTRGIWLTDWIDC